MAKEYIEREAVKRELLSWAVNINHPEYLIKDDALHVIDSMPAADVVEQEQESKPLNGWISVQDRLPEEKGRYLTANKRYGDKIVVFDLWFGGGFWYVEEEDDVFDFEVTHWMPMPNPPKGEERKGGSDND